jgi:ubiquinone/menaquinone biosynthesis C-methylase UbiE
MNYPVTGADRELSRQQYGLRAPVYDRELAAFEPIRRNAIDLLQLEPGATVIDVGCGTGLSFERLQSAIGQSGQVVGIEQCDEMLNLARARVAQQDWTNVTLLDTAAEVASITARGDAALFHFTHDILRNPDAIARVVQCLRPGARVVAVGLQWSHPWAWATNWWVLLAALRSVTSLEGLDQPWSLLAAHLEQLEVSTTLLGGVFIASGVLRR